MRLLWKSAKWKKMLTEAISTPVNIATIEWNGTNNVSANNLWVT